MFKYRSSGIDACRAQPLRRIPVKKSLSELCLYALATCRTLARRARETKMKHDKKHVTIARTTRPRDRDGGGPVW
jgi:hypothetical protein